MRSYQDIINKVMPIYRKQPKRFRTFYDNVFLILTDLKPGRDLVIRACCTERSRELFIDCAEMIMYEEYFHKIDLKRGELEFVDDTRSIIRRLPPINIRMFRNSIKMDNKL